MKVKTCDVLVIGSGGAGLRCAIELFDKNVDVLVVGKCKRRDAHTIMATGGINASLGNLDEKDSWQLHAADTIKDGNFINDIEAVKILCKNAPKAIKELNEWGCEFAKDKNGKILQRFFGAATYRRACFVGDHTGKAILNTLVNQTLKRRIKFKSEIYIFSLLKNKNQVNGAIGIDINSGKLIIIHAKAVVLATGGHSKMFSRSSSRFFENNGDGIYLSYKLGCNFQDMEMFQFHPTGMLYPTIAEGLLVTEAVRGEGGILLNSKKERFMEKYDSERMELSARDVVARAIFNEVKLGNGSPHGGVWLDVSHKSREYIMERLPKMFYQLKKYNNVDISKEPMEVGPTAHYSMGGIKTNHKTGETRIKGLYAIGEVTAGVHGGNRLGGNSLAEIVVFGRLVGGHIAKSIKKQKLIGLDSKMIGEELEEFSKFFTTKGENPIKIKHQLQIMMLKFCGVVRNKESLEYALERLDEFKKIKFSISDTLKKNERLIAALDIRNMIPTCEMILLSALKRAESRGAHYRSDYPKSKKSWVKNIICTPTKNVFKLQTKKVDKIPKSIEKFFKETPKLHLLE